MDHNEMIFDPIKDEKNDVSTNVKQDEESLLIKPAFSIPEEKFDLVMSSGKQNMEEREYFYATDAEKQITLVENGISNFLKLKSFFEIVQNQHPESRLELQQVEGNWRVWCGVCKKLLRPDKSGKALHNIQRQHFTSTRHQKKLQAEEEAERERQNPATEDIEIPAIEHQDGKTE